MGLLGILGLPDSEDEKWKRKQEQAGLLGPEQPSYMARMGRGFTDVGDALGQAYYNLKVWDPAQAEGYRADRAAEARLYDKGFHYGHTLDGEPLPENLQGLYVDPWRTAGQVAAIVPAWAAAAPASGARALQYVGQTAISGAASGELMKQVSLWPAMMEYLLKRQYGGR